MEQTPSISDIKVEICDDDDELFSDLQVCLPSDDELEDAFIENGDKAILSLIERIHTRRATQWSLCCWNTWRKQRVELKGTEFEDIPYFYELCNQPIQSMDTILAYFVLSCKNKAYENYTPVTLRSILFGLQRYMKAFAVHFNKLAVIFIKNEHLFPNYCDALKKRIKTLKEAGVESKVPPAAGITLTQEESLWNTGVFGSSSAEVLSNTIFFYIVKIFGIISGRALRKLSTDSFVFGENEFGQYVELANDFANYSDEFFNSCSPCCHNQTLLVLGTNKLRHYRNNNNPRSFYNIFRYYLKLIVAAQVRTENALFLQPKKDLIFSSSPIGKNQLQKKFGSIMKAAKFKGSYTTQALVQSAMDCLQTKCYNIKRKQVFQTEQQVEISILLDPPIGMLQSTGFTMQSNAFNQLVGMNPMSQVLTLTKQPVTYILQAKPTYQIGSLVALQVSQQPTKTPPQKVPITLTDNPHTITTYQKSSGNLRHVLPKLTSVNESFQQVHHTNSSTVEAKNNSIKKTCSNFKCDKDSSENDGEVFKDDDIGSFYENQDDADNKTDNSSLGNLPVIVVKEEPTEYHGVFENQNAMENCRTEQNNLASVADNQISASNKRKTTEYLMASASKAAKVNKSSEFKCAIVDGSQQSKESFNKEKSTEHSNDNLHHAEIEYNFNNDFDKKTIKQEIVFKEDDTTVFSCCGQSRAGRRTMSDIDINLGDYLPENCIIRPNDIDLKRVILPGGGKMILKLKYKLEN